MVEGCWMMNNVRIMEYVNVTDEDFVVCCISSNEDHA